MNREEYAASVARHMTEAALQAQVLDLSGRLTFRGYHTFDSRKSVAGFPDLVLVSAARHRCIFAELKKESGKVTAAQRRWLDELRDSGQEAYLWRPSDLIAGTVLAILRERPTP